MPPVMVGLVAAASVALVALIPFLHGAWVGVAVGDAAAATGWVGYVTAPRISAASSIKKAGFGELIRMAKFRDDVHVIYVT